MLIAAAQLRPVAGDVAGNLRAHAGLVSLAASRGAGLVFFPELSLTGYEPTLAARLAVDPGDPLPDSLLELQAQADAKGIVIAVGLPTRAPDGIRITMATLRPGASPWLYSKQWLHADESPYFVPGPGRAILRAGGHAIAPAI
ncbi:MAG TPA: nitrilase-related carbon-nitrogen hydrolase, partial [Quisquiliibacterium sp.]|nr:nitrilase-related carbon-nitrogen hydrolase [Quisquiliibacterium sp.]